MHERRGQAVREPEVCVRLGQRSRNASQPRRDDHRPCDVAAAPEHDVRPAAREDTQTRGGRGGGETERAEEPRAGTARHAHDAEGVEGVAALRNEPRLDAIRRPGERHFHPARAQCFRYCE